MPVPKITADQFATQLNQSINNRNAGHDTEIGPIPDIVVEPVAEVLENQNDRIRNVSQLILLDQSATFADSDVDNFVGNESLKRLTGGKSTGTVTFARGSAPTSDITVQQNYPIATFPDESTGQTVVFVTTTALTMVAANAVSYFNINTQKYELSVPVMCTIAGSLGVVGPGTITRPLRPLIGFDSVSNVNKTSPVTDIETNAKLLDRYKISILGTQLGTRNGLRLFILGSFVNAGDVIVATAGDPIITRAASDAGAVDVFLTGSQPVTTSETQTFLGVGQTIVLDIQPVVDIVSVPGFTLNTDYILVKDTSGVSNSVQAKDGIQFLPTATSFPAIGSTITVQYDYDSLVAEIQDAITANSDNEVGGQDVLARTGSKVEIVLVAQMSIYPGFVFSAVQSLVIAAIQNYINTFGLDGLLEESNVDLVARSISGVSNFVFVTFARLGNSGHADIPLQKNEFPEILTGNITITPL